MKVSCSVEWQDQSFNVKSYNITIFICAFFFPVIVIIITNLKVIKTVKKFLLKLFISKTLLLFNYISSENRAKV